MTWLALAASVVASLIFAGAASAQAGAPAGRVNLAQAAESSFDRYTLDPRPAEQRWMSDHYWRLRTYAPYFDSRLSWFGGAWAYYDAYAIYRGSSLAGQHPEWILKDAQGRNLYIPYDCNGTTCSQNAADIGSPAWRRHFIDNAKALIAQGYKGIFVDDVNFAFSVSDGAGNHVDPIDPRTGQPMAHATWQRYLAEFMEQLRAELPQDAEIVQNQVYFHAGPANPYVRRAIDAATHIEIERGVNDSGIYGGGGQFGFETVLAWIDYTHSRGKGVVYDVQADWGREYALSTYFLNSNGRDGIGMDSGGVPDDWWQGYETDLGAPLGARYGWNGVFRRDFEHGTVLVNQPGAADPHALARVRASSASTARPSRRLTLAARDGVVLTRAASAAADVSASTPAPAAPASAPAKPAAKSKRAKSRRAKRRQRAAQLRRASRRHPARAVTALRYNPAS